MSSVFKATIENKTTSVRRTKTTVPFLGHPVDWLNRPNYSGVTRRRGGPPRMTPSRMMMMMMMMMRWHRNEINFVVAEFKKNTEPTTSESGSCEERTAKQGHHKQASLCRRRRWLKRSSVFRGKISDTVSWRPGWHQPWWRHCNIGFNHFHYDGNRTEAERGRTKLEPSESSFLKNRTELELGAKRTRKKRETCSDLGLLHENTNRT